MAHFADRYALFVWMVQEVEERLKVLGLLDAVLVGSRLSLHAHLHYLPAVKAYLDCANGRSPRGRHGLHWQSARGRLGAQAREMYRVQRPLFDLSIKLLLSLGAFATTGGIGLAVVEAGFAAHLDRWSLDHLWRYFKHVEASHLARTRIPMTRKSPL